MLQINNYRKIIMFNSNRNENNILYKKEFDECINGNRNLKIIYTIAGEGQDRSSSHSSSGTVHDEWKGERGFIDKAMLIKYLTEDELNNSIFYVCGPLGMLKGMQKLLQDDLHIPEGRIKIEEFTGY